MSHHTCGASVGSCFQCIEDSKAYGEKVVAQRTAAQQDADKFGLLEKEIVAAAEKWFHHVYEGIPSQQEAIDSAFDSEMIGEPAGSLLASVARYIKARSEDARR